MNVLFISFADGSCGNLLAKIIQCMSRGYVPNPNRPFNHMHFDLLHEDPIINRCPFINEFADIWPSVLKYCTAANQNDKQGIEYIQKNFNIPKANNFPFHIILTNLLHITPLLSVPASKIIKIQITESEVQQVSYNFVTKMYDVLIHLQRDTILNWVTFIQQNYCRLHWFKPDNLDLPDAKFLTWLYWLNKREFHASSVQHQLLQNPQCLTINLSSILDKTILNDLDKIAEFIEVTISDEEKNTIAELLERYLANQVKIPYMLKIEDYY